jgi:spermidine synthase
LARRALVVGLGAGSILQHLLTRGLEVVAVECDREVAHLASEHFFSSDEIESVVVGDGVAILREHNRKHAAAFDIVLVDVVDPSSLDSVWRFLDPAVLEDLRQAVSTTKTGLLVFNVVSLDDGRLVRAVAAVLGRRWSFVRAFRDSPFSDKGPTNVVFFASDAKIDDLNLERRDNKDSERHGSEAWVVANFQRWEVARCAQRRCEIFWPEEHQWDATEDTYYQRPPPEYELELSNGLRKLTESYLPNHLRPPPCL